MNQASAPTRTGLEQSPRRTIIHSNCYRSGDNKRPGHYHCQSHRHPLLRCPRKHFSPMMTLQTTQSTEETQQQELTAALTWLLEPIQESQTTANKSDTETSAALCLSWLEQNRARLHLYDIDNGISRLKKLLEASKQTKQLTQLYSYAILRSGLKEIQPRTAATLMDLADSIVALYNSPPLVLETIETIVPALLSAIRQNNWSIFSLHNEIIRIQKCCTAIGAHEASLGFTLLLVSELKSSNHHGEALQLLSSALSTKSLETLQLSPSTESSLLQVSSELFSDLYYRAANYSAALDLALALKSVVKNDRIPYWMSIVSAIKLEKAELCAFRPRRPADPGHGDHLIRSWRPGWAESAVEWFCCLSVRCCRQLQGCWFC